MTQQHRGAGLLEGIRILDLADEKASFCSKLLADLGARVIKIEKPGGDASRKAGPFLKNVPESEASLFFSYNNTGKLSITLDLEQEEGQKIFFRLLAKTDIVVETFPVDDHKKTGLTYPLLKDTHPKLIWVSTTGFGQNGPRSHDISNDLVAAACGGQMYINGSSASAPLKPFGEQSYYTASLFAAVGILIALRKRRQTGQGEFIDISLQESAASVLDHVLFQYFYEQTVAKRQGGIYWNHSFCILPCLDGQMLIAPFQQWETLVEWLKSESMAEDLEDEKYLSAEHRLDHVEHILQVLKKWTKTHTKEELFETGQQLRFTWAPVLAPKDVLKSPQLQARNFFSTIADGQGNASLSCPGSPYQFSQTTFPRSERAPSAGNDNFQIYQGELGLTKEECAKLSAMKII